MVTKEIDDRPRPGQQVIWLQQRKWGGKQNVPAVFLRAVGLLSARIKVDGLGNKTVRWASLSWNKERSK
jgi:hypothetical protein